MAYAEAVAGLKRLMRRDLFASEAHPDDPRLTQHNDESDRSLIILLSALVERALVFSLTRKMPTINGEERARLFDFNGPLGSFSSRIQMAQALGVISRPIRRKIDLLREMRNVSAHAHEVVTFDTPEIREATLSLIGEPDRCLAEGLDGEHLRLAFRGYSILLYRYALGTEGEPSPERIERIRACLSEWAAGPPLPDKS